MAVAFNGSAVRKRYWFAVLTAALVLCIVITLLLVSRINDARTQLAQTGPGAFNYLLQSNRNLDAYVDALRDYRELESGSEDKPRLRKVYQQRFDVVWGGFTVFDISFNFRPEQQKLVTDLLEFATDYLTTNESLMVPGYELSDNEIGSLITGSRSITEKIVYIAHQYFIFSTQINDFWNGKLHRLSQLFWACVVLLILTGTLLYGMLVQSIRQSAVLIEKSHKTQREMKRLIDQLRSGKLEKKAKDSFIAAASHDLRQPLHALGLFLGATEKHIENEAGREALAEAKHCTAELNRLFNSLLDLSRLDAGVIEANKKQFKLDRLLGLMDQEFSALALQSDIQFHVCRDFHYVYTDAILLNRVLRNLLENAFSHSNATEVHILCERRDHTVRLTVSDNGTGIPAAEQSEIFSEYYQLNNPERDRSKGLGLGLSIVKRLCDILGVDITLESGAQMGTKFHLDVPAAKMHSSFLRESAVAPVKSWNIPEGTLVAVIDDDVNVRRGMISILESFEFKAVAAESANEMIRKLRLQSHMPDIIIADYRLLENQTGDMAIHQVRSAFGIDFPAMIITGDTSPARVKEAASSGFELMHKPVEPVELVRRMSSILKPVREPVAEAN